MSANIDAVLARLDEMNNGEINYEVYRELHDWTRFDESVKRAVEEACAEYDRMLAEVERAAAARALEEAADDIESRRNEPGLVHLDVRYAGYYTGIRSGMESDSKALRVRAAEIREGKNDE